LVKLRLKRMGKKKKPVYRIIVADARSPRDGRFIEEIGFYDPNTEPMTIHYKEDKVKILAEERCPAYCDCAKPVSKEGLLYKLRMIKEIYRKKLLKSEMQKFFEAKKSKHEKELTKKINRKTKKAKSKTEKKEGEEAK